MPALGWKFAGAAFGLSLMGEMRRAMLLGLAPNKDDCDPPVMRPLDANMAGEGEAVEDTLEALEFGAEAAAVDAAAVSGVEVEFGRSSLAKLRVPSFGVTFGDELSEPLEDTGPDRLPCSEARTPEKARVTFARLEGAATAAAAAEEGG